MQLEKRIKNTLTTFTILLLLNKTDYIEDKIYESLYDDIQELLKLLVSIIKSSKIKKYYEQFSIIN